LGEKEILRWPRKGKKRKEKTMEKPNNFPLQAVEKKHKVLATHGGWGGGTKTGNQ